MNTPWGISDYKKELCEGITFYGTPSHGGLHVSDDKLMKMPEILQQIVPFAGKNWYEEDCDWAIIANAFPSLFTDEEVNAAIKLMKKYHNRQT